MDSLFSLNQSCKEKSSPAGENFFMERSVEVMKVSFKFISSIQFDLCLLCAFHCKITTMELISPEHGYCFNIILSICVTLKSRL